MERLKCPHCGAEPIEPQDFDTNALAELIEMEVVKGITIDQVEPESGPMLQVPGRCPECKKLIYGFFRLKKVRKEPLKE